MKKLLCVFTMLAMLFMISGCAQDMKLEDGKVYQAYGIANPEFRDPKVAYEVSLGSVIVAVLFFETVAIPIYVVGWDLYEPVTVGK